MFNVNGDNCHDLVMDSIKPKYSFDRSKDLFAQGKAIKEKFIEISGINKIKENDCPLDYEVVEEVQEDGYKRIKIHYLSEKDMVVPCYLLVPNGVEKAPLCIVLQGNTKGYKYSVGLGDEYVLEDDFTKPDYNRVNYAIQAVKRGYCALAIEQRAMGELFPYDTGRNWMGRNRSGYTSFYAITLGRTTIGERVWDMSKAIDVMEKFPMVDTDKIVITGNHVGGVTAYYAAVYDERIKVSMPSCAFCSYRDSILDISATYCQIMPKAYLNFDMQDLAMCIAPRNLVVISDENDESFPFDKAVKSFETVKEIYTLMGAEDNCMQVYKKGDAIWDEEVSFDALKNVTEKLGW